MVILLYFLCSLFSLYSITICICSVLCVHTYMSAIYFGIYVFAIHVYIDIVILITTITHVHTRLYIKTFCVSNKFVCMQFPLDSNERVSIKICYSFWVLVIWRGCSACVVRLVEKRRFLRMPITIILVIIIFIIK